MLDLREIRENPALFDERRTYASLAPLAETLLDLDQKHRKAQTSLQEMQAQRRELSQQIGKLKKEQKDCSDLIQTVEELKGKMLIQEQTALSLGQEIDSLLLSEPNLAEEGVPQGKDETENVELRTEGVKPEFSFSPKSHFELGEGLKISANEPMMDFERAAKMSGARYVVLKGQLARLERALAQFMMDLHTEEHDLLEVEVPYLVRSTALLGTGQLPKFEEDLYKTEEGSYLIPTAEVPLTNLVSQEILEEDRLPLRFCSFSPCFRSEAGSAGRDTRGMFRQHQFHKVEMVSVTKPEHSSEELERMLGCAETVLQRLKLPYRVVTLCTGDLGFSAQKTYDIEVWLPGQSAYREISSCSNTGAFQARRMNARYRAPDQKKPQFVHTLNGSGLAVGRCLVAVLENYQNEDGSIAIPEVLQPYMKGMSVLR